MVTWSASMDQVWSDWHSGDKELLRPFLGAWIFWTLPTNTGSVPFHGKALPCLCPWRVFLAPCLSRLPSPPLEEGQKWPGGSSESGKTVSISLCIILTWGFSLWRKTYLQEETSHLWDSWIKVKYGFSFFLFNLGVFYLFFLSNCASKTTSIILNSSGWKQITLFHFWS